MLLTGLMPERDRAFPAHGRASGMHSGGSEERRCRAGWLQRSGGVGYREEVQSVEITCESSKKSVCTSNDGK